MVTTLRCRASLHGFDSMVTALKRSLRATSTARGLDGLGIADLAALGGTDSHLQCVSATAAEMSIALVCVPRMSPLVFDVVAESGAVPMTVRMTAVLSFLQCVCSSCRRLSPRS